MGIFLSIISAVLDSLRAACNKKCLQWFDEYYIAWATSALGVLILSPVVLFGELPDLTDAFWVHLCITGFINSVTVVLVLKALREGDLSLVAPLRSFSPFFLLFTSPILLNETPTFFGLVGIVIVLIGSYVLEFRSISYGFLDPLKSLWSQSAARLMLVCTLLWSVSSCYAKLAILQSGSSFFTFSLFAFMALSLTPIVFFRKPWPKDSKRLTVLIILAVLLVAEHLVTWTAFSLTLAVYVLSIKRLGLVLSVVLGRMLFDEPRFLIRVSACVIMILGAFLIAL